MRRIAACIIAVILLSLAFSCAKRTEEAGEAAAEAAPSALPAYDPTEEHRIVWKSDRPVAVPAREFPPGTVWVLGELGEYRLKPENRRAVFRVRVEVWYIGAKQGEAFLSEVSARYDELYKAFSDAVLSGDEELIAETRKAFEEYAPPEIALELGEEIGRLIGEWLSMDLSSMNDKLYENYCDGYLTWEQLARFPADPDYAYLICYAPDPGKA